MNQLTAYLTVKAYRMVPAKIRGYYPGFPTSTSHLFKHGDNWSTLFRLVGDSKVPRPELP